MSTVEEVSDQRTQSITESIEEDGQERSFCTRTRLKHPTSTKSQPMV